MTKRRANHAIEGKFHSGHAVATLENGCCQRSSPCINEARKIETAFGNGQAKPTGRIELRDGSEGIFDAVETVY
jgi:hypothetical protein